MLAYYLAMLIVLADASANDLSLLAIARIN